MGCEHPRHLLHRYLTQVRRHEEIDKVVGIRQATAGPALGGDPPVETKRADVCPGLPDVVWIGVQTLNDAALVRCECRSQSAVAATDVDDQTALDTGCVEDSPRLLTLPAQGAESGYQRQ